MFVNNYFFRYDLILKKFQKNSKKVLTKCSVGVIMVLPKHTKGEHMNKSKSVKTSISLNEKIYNKAKQMADEMGFTFSAFIAVLIAEKSKESERRK